MANDKDFVISGEYIFAHDLKKVNCIDVDDPSGFCSYNKNNPIFVERIELNEDETMMIALRTMLDCYDDNIEAAIDNIDDFIESIKEKDSGLVRKSYIVNYVSFDGRVRYTDTPCIYDENEFSDIYEAAAIYGTAISIAEEESQRDEFEKRYKTIMEYSEAYNASKSMAAKNRVVTQVQCALSLICQVDGRADRRMTKEFLAFVLEGRVTKEDFCRIN